MTSTILVHTQYYENYNVGPNGFGETPHWKPKGGHTFKIEMDTDVLFYCGTEAEVFQRMLDKHETIAERFKYVEHEVQWQEPTLLGTEAEFLDIIAEVETNLKTSL